jgi:hypothetical protein
MYYHTMQISVALSVNEAEFCAATNNAQDIYSVHKENHGAIGIACAVANNFRSRHQRGSILLKQQQCGWENSAFVIEIVIPKAIAGGRYYQAHLICIRRTWHVRISKNMQRLTSETTIT